METSYYVELIREAGKIPIGRSLEPERPVGKARERNEEAIRGWQRKLLAAIKKKVGAKKNQHARLLDEQLR